MLSCLQISFTQDTSSFAHSLVMSKRPRPRKFHVRSYNTPDTSEGSPNLTDYDPASPSYASSDGSDPDPEQQHGFFFQVYPEQNNQGQRRHMPRPNQDGDVVLTNTMGDPSEITRIYRGPLRVFGCRKGIPGGRRCAMCGVKTKSRCNACTSYREYYCSTVCQRRDWRLHKVYCERYSPASASVSESFRLAKLNNKYYQAHSKTPQLQ
jgi:hypothetical protein